MGFPDYEQAIEAATEQRMAPRVQATSRRGVTLIECLWAMAVLGLTSAAIGSVMSSASYQHAYSDRQMRATQLAEDLMEEVISRPAEGGGATREGFSVDGFHGWEELPGELCDAMGEAYPDADQRYRRRVAVVAELVSLPGLDGLTVAGRRVTIVVDGPSGTRAEVSQFLADAEEGP